VRNSLQFRDSLLSLVSFRWEGKTRGKSASSAGIGFTRERSEPERASSTVAPVSSIEVPRVLLPHGTPLQDNQSQPGTLQGAKKNSSRKASTFRQVTTKRTCERGWCRRTRRRSTSRLLARAWSLRDHLPLLLHTGRATPHSRASRRRRAYRLLDHVLPASTVGQCG